MVFIKFIHSKKLTIGRLTKMDISYQIHARDLGWLPQISNGQPAGILGATVIEAITISANGLPQGVSLRYRVYSADVGWGEWQRSGGVAGTTQKGLQAENIQIELVGAKDNLGAICSGLICPDTSIGGQSTIRGDLHDKATPQFRSQLQAGGRQNDQRTRS